MSCNPCSLMAPKGPPTAIEILQFLAMEIPSVCLVETEVCLFQSHSTPGAVSLKTPPAFTREIPFWNQHEAY